MRLIACSIVIVFSALVVACPFGEATSPEPAPAVQPPPGPPPAPVPAGPPPFAASKLAVPLVSVTGDHLRAALTGGGWEMASVSTSGGLVSAMARKNGVLARISYHNPINVAHRRRLEQETKAVHVEGNALLGVVIDGNEPAAQTLLTSLLGHPPSGAAAPAQPGMPAQPAVAQPAAPAPMPVAPIPAIPPPAMPQVPVQSQWNGLAPLSCAGAQQMTITGQTVNLPGMAAISASGMCQLTLINCNINAGQALVASGMARIVIHGGRLQGSQAAIVATGSANVSIQGAQIVGRVQRSGVATVQGAP